MLCSNHPSFSKWCGSCPFFPCARSSFVFSGCVSKFMEDHFPNVVARFKKVADYIWKEYGKRPKFGYFYCLCLNIPVPDEQWRVLLRPHLDFKNPIAICVVYVYCKANCGCLSARSPPILTLVLASGMFNSKERTWLVIWELGVVIELPAGVFALFPSSLLHHFNIDVHGTLLSLHASMPI